MKEKISVLPVNRFFSASKTMTDSNEVPAFTPMLSGCLEFLKTLPAARSRPAGSLLIEQGLPAEQVLLIQSGLVKLVHLNAAGREVTIGLRTEGWYAGSTSILLNAPSVYAVRAVTPCTVVRIPAAVFSDCLKTNPGMLDHFLAGLCFEVASQAHMQVEMMSSSAEDRLEHFMRERMTTHPSRKTLDPLPVLKQMEIAQLLSITPEHLSRLLHKRKVASHRALAGREPVAGD